MDPSEQQLERLATAAHAPAVDLASAIAAANASDQLVKALRRPARRDPGRYRERATAAARIHAANLATVVVHCRDQDRFQSLIHYGRQAAKRLRKIPGPETEGRLARVLTDLAFGHVACQQLASASRANRRAQRLLRRLVRRDPDRYLGVLADTHYTASGIAGLRGKHRVAMGLAERAVDLFQEAAHRNPAEYTLLYQRALDSLLQNVESFGSRRDLRRIHKRHLPG